MMDSIGIAVFAAIVISLPRRKSVGGDLAVVARRRPDKRADSAGES
jgi:hypothetical protein